MKFYWIDGEWVAKGELNRPEPKAPYVWGKLPEYQSPLSFDMVDGRTQRREEMKRYNVREVDPGERPEGIGIPKTEAQAAAEREQLANREIYDIPQSARDRLMRGS